MNTVRSAVRFAVLLVGVLAAVPAFAGNGAVVTRYAGGAGGIASIPADLGMDLLLIGTSPGPTPFWCEGGGEQLLITRFLWVVKDDQLLFVAHEGKAFVWLFPGALAAQLPGVPYESDEWWYGLCDLIRTETPVADGVVELYALSNDAGAQENGGYSWGDGMTGTLNDRTGECPGGKTHFSFHERFRLPASADYPACYPDCVMVTKKARLTCE